jgi:alanyl-tRNA synthetase
MIHTNRLYFDDPTGSPFEAVVVAHALSGDRPSLILDRSGFYPESGGQMADRGLLGGLEVVDVQVDDAGRVHHVLSVSDLPAVGATVRGEPDRRRRRVHQALHTGQHMLSRALVDVAAAETISSRLGETACTIDTPGETLREADLARAEALVNDMVDADVPVRAFFPDAETLATLPLRRAPKVTDDVRVVMVGDFDCSPCGGTHCTGSAQVGFVRVTGLERYKGGLRITFNAGPRARQSLFGQQDVLQALARGFTCGPADVPTAVERLRRDLTDTKAAAGRLQERLVDQIAARLLAGAGPAPRFVLSFPGEDATFLRLLGRRLAEVPGTSAILCAPATDGAGGARYLAVRGPGADFDCGAFVRRLNAQTGGRGGGRAETAEGSLPVAPEDWAALVDGLAP